MKLLCSSAAPGVETVKVADLTPILRVGEPKPPDLHESLDRRGMVNPLVCVRMDADEWLRWSMTHKQAQGVVPVFHVEDGRAFVLAVRVGNQRLEYAGRRGYDWISAVICPTMVEAVAWRALHYGDDA